MDLLDVPFNRLLGLRRGEEGSGWLLELDDSPSYTNHLGTVHAAAQLGLAEAGCAECLARAFPELVGRVLFVVRRVEAKFRNPMRGRVGARGSIPEDVAARLREALRAKERGLIGVTVEIVDQAGVVGLVATFEWFIQRREQG
jgi:hypothetical protein